MDAIALALIAIVFYCAAATYQLLALQRKAPNRPPLIRLLGSAAVLNHGLSVWLAIFQYDGIHLGLTEMGLLATFTISLMLLISSIKKPVLNLGIGVFPMSMLALIFAIWGPVSTPSNGLAPGLTLHILTSLV
ncbi:MAG: cytochrome C biogenesis protein, partial [Oceanospirillum sp.]|nr:cytochrome C biogenesis protein [Oceanospirillum sp.]